jgi:hypothetical protein
VGRIHRLSAVSVVAVLAACSEATVPEPPSTGIFSYACGRWNAGPRPDRLVLADVLYETEVNEQALAEAGAVVLHRFEGVPAVRVAVLAGRIPRLGAVRVEGVRDPERFDLRVLVTFRDPVTEDDLEFLRQLGARNVRPLPESQTVVEARIPDAALSLVRRLPGVQSAEPFRTLCR